MKAGFHEADVTPPVGVYLAGYPSRSTPSEGIDDPLYLRIAVLEDDSGGRLVLVTADLLKFPRDMAWRTKRWCRDTLGLSSASVIINLSHTHSAPGLFPQGCYPQWPVDIEYVRTFEQAIREGIEAAIRDLQPVQIRYGLHQAHFGVSRRLPQPEQGGRVRMAPNPDGFYDPDLPVFAFHGSEGLRAVLYSYACHPTSKATLNISADWPGEVSRGLKRQLGGQVMTLFAQGAGASIMPRRQLGDNPNGYAEYWAEVADHIASFVQSDNLQEIDLQLRAAEKEFLIPYDLEKVPSPEQLAALADPRDTPIPPEWRPANRSILRLWAAQMLESVRTNTVDPAFRMHLTRVALNDDLQIIGMSGEVTAEVGKAVKDLFPDKKTTFLGYCSYTDAYIPTAAMLPEGGHEALGSVFFHDRPAPFVKEIDEIIEREVLALAV
jgi:neutral ceramidase